VTLPITDAEIRGALLKHFYEVKDINDGLGRPSEILLSPSQVSRRAIANVCQQLAEAGYIQWKPFSPQIPQLALGTAKITGTGIDVVTGARAPTIDIRFPHIGERDVSAGLALAPKEAEAKSSASEYQAPPTRKVSELISATRTRAAPMRARPWSFSTGSRRRARCATVMGASWFISNSFAKRRSATIIPLDRCSCP
jgi:hypothetical protein